MTDILMPALSPTMEEGKLAKWLVKVGDKVASGDVIAEIETDKATMEVEAVDEGIVEAILVEEGAEGVKVNAPIARLSGEGGAAPSAPPSTPAHPEEPTVESQPAPEDSAPRERETIRRSEDAAPPAAVRDGQRIFASPLARRLAEQKGVDLSALSGSGPRGRIVAADVAGASPGQPAPKAAPAAGPAASREAAPRQVLTLAQQGIPDGSYDLVPLDGVRKVTARRLTDAFRDVPHFPLTIDLEIDRLLAARTAVNALLEKDGVKVSVNDMVIKATAMACRREPDANASYTPEGIARHHHADISMAVAIEGGLITPIIRKAELKSLSEIAVETKDLAERARKRRLKPEEYQGGTFSVSNLGMFGIRTFASILNEPQGCILSVGAGERRPVVRGDSLEIATVMTVTLTCDHRVVDGAAGARWLAAFKTLIEEPVAMLA